MKAHPQLWRSLALIVVAAVLLVCGIFVSRATVASSTSSDIETPTGRQLMEFDGQRVVKPDASTTMEKSIEQRQSSSSILRELLADNSLGDGGETTKTTESLARVSRYRGLERIEDDPFIHERRMKKSKMKSASKRAAAAPTATAATPRPAPTTPTRTPVVVNAPTSVIILGSKKAKASKKAKVKKASKGAKISAPTGPAGRSFKSSSAKAYVFIR